MNKPICPVCEDNSGVYPMKDEFTWHCGYCNRDFEEEE